MSPPQRVVVAGGIGSGKSTVTAALSQLGWSVISADQVGNEVLTDPGVVELVASQWPMAVVGGQVSRPALAGIVFNDVEELRVLEEMTHPGIVGRIDSWIKSSNEPMAMEVSVLKLVRPEWGSVAVVHAPAELRLQRTLERGMDLADARARMAAQPPDTEWLSAADIVFDNQGMVPDLMAIVARFDRWAKT